MFFILLLLFLLFAYCYGVLFVFLYRHRTYVIDTASLLL